jgi:hypothetical protein
MTKKTGESRRDFLIKRFTNKVNLLTDLANTMKDESENQNEKIKMLTPDGKLVEVDKALIENSSSASKASNEQILNWMKPNKKV